MMVWMYGGMIGGIIGLVAQFVGMYGYDQYYTLSTNADPAIAAAAKFGMHEFEISMITMAASETLIGVELYEQGWNWMVAQMMNMADGKSEEMMEEMMDEETEEVPEELFRAVLNYMF